MSQVWTFLVSDATFKTSATGSGSTNSAPEVHVDKVQIVAVRLQTFASWPYISLPKIICTHVPRLLKRVTTLHGLGSRVWQWTDINRSMVANNEPVFLAWQVDAKLVVL